MKNVLYVLTISLCFSGLSIAQQKEIDHESLEGKSLEELYLLRNEIFARHGRPFKTSELNTYFRSQEWYKLDLEYDDSRLSGTDIANVNIIKRRELELLKHNYIYMNGVKKINFNNVINRRQFGEFSKDDVDKLCDNGFLVIQAKHEQFFYLYEENNYKGIANFVTTDAILQLYHIFFNFTLRTLEKDKLVPILKTLTHEMVKHSKKLYIETDNEKIKEAALRSLAYFTVPHYFLTGDSSVIDPLISKIAGKEIEKCEKHILSQNSLIFNPDADPAIKHCVDYTQFVPRGHYTRSEELKRYFMAMMWFGQNCFIAEEELDLIQSLIITQQLCKNRVNNERLIDLWEKIYEPTVFYAGLSDDPGPQDYRLIINKVYGANPEFDDFADDDGLERSKILAIELYEKTKIRVQMVGIPDNAQFRFMGQRYIPDSEILQRLSNWPKRPLPSGLDVAAVLGSRQAKKILLEEYREGDRWVDYPFELEKLFCEFSYLKPSDWKQNLYYSWVWCLKALLEQGKEFIYPYFMQNDAWELKSLNTSLASWAELRHDVILYGKGVGAECGNGEEWYPDPPKSYVEPNVRFYRRLGELLSFTKEGLKERDILPERAVGKFKRFSELLAFLEKVSVKELAGQPLTRQEYVQIKIFGTLLENLTISVMVDKRNINWYYIASEVDKSIAVIADVATSQNRVLEEGVGPAFEIFVVVEIDGYLKLTRGAVFSYYEFTHPADDRLTDEKWQKMLKEREEPPLPGWIRRYLSDQPAHDVPRPRYTYSSGC